MTHGGGVVLLCTDTHTTATGFKAVCFTKVAGERSHQQRAHMWPLSTNKGKRVGAWQLLARQRSFPRGCRFCGACTAAQ